MTPTAIILVSVLAAGLLFVVIFMLVGCSFTMDILEYLEAIATLLQSEAKLKTRYEYKCLVVADHSSLNSNTVMPILEEQAQKGWEFVALLPGPRHSLLLKREK